MTVVRSVRFVSDLVLRELPGGERFALAAPLVCLLHGRGYVTVPIGTETDFASVPRLLWPLLPPYGPHSRAAVLHDWLYQVAPAGTTRAEADALFRCAMAGLRVAGWRRGLMYLGVRAGGRRAWRRYRALPCNAVAATS